jgi:hypothetical protein
MNKEIKPQLYKPFDSSLPKKKYSVLVKNKDKFKVIHFGQKGAKDFKSGTATKEERDAYRKRASKIKKKDGSLAILDKDSPAYWSYNYSWDK